MNTKKSYLHIEATHNLALNCINSFLHAKREKRHKHVSRQQVVVRREVGIPWVARTPRTV